MNQKELTSDGHHDFKSCHPSIYESQYEDNSERAPKKSSHNLRLQNNKH